MIVASYLWRLFALNDGSWIFPIEISDWLKISFIGFGKDKEITDGRWVQFCGYRTAPASDGAGMSTTLVGSRRVWLQKVIPATGRG